MSGSEGTERVLSCNSWAGAGSLQPNLCLPADGAVSLPLLGGPARVGRLAHSKQAIDNAELLVFERAGRRGEENINCSPWTASLLHHDGSAAKPCPMPSMPSMPTRSSSSAPAVAVAARRAQRVVQQLMAQRACEIVGRLVVHAAAVARVALPALGHGGGGSSLACGRKEGGRQ